MGQGKRKLIGVAGGWLKLENSANLIAELQMVAQVRGYVIVCFSFTTNSEKDNEEVAANLHLADLAGWTDLDALVVLGETIRNKTIIDRLIGSAQEKKIPVFLAERHMEGCINIHMDYEDGFAQVVRHVVEFHSCRRVLMMAGMRNNSFSDTRIRMYRKVLEENGIPYEPENVLYGDFWDGPTIREMEKFLSSGRTLPEAIVCANDSMAVAVCDTLEQHGIHVPEDVIVTGFDGIPQGKNHEPVLTTVEPDFRREARLIVEQLDQWSPDQAGVTKDYVIGYHVALHQSCGCESRENYNWNGIITRLANDLQDSTNHISEMGRLVDRLFGMDNVYDITGQLRHRLHLWHGNNRYYCVVVTANLVRDDTGNSPFRDTQLAPVYRCWGTEDHQELQPYDQREVLPDLEQLIDEDSGVNVIYFRPMNVMSRYYGFVCSGFAQARSRDFQRLEELAMFMSSTVNTIWNNRRIDYMSDHDYLTSLYNREGFLKRLEKVISDEDFLPDDLHTEPKKKLVFISIDLDGLKVINDNYGHHQGDRAIIALSKAIGRMTTSRGLAARYGGDEFAAALILDADQTYEATADDLRSECRELIRREMGDVPFTVEASAGIVCVPMVQGMDLEPIMKVADERMYADKKLRHRERQ